MTPGVIIPSASASTSASVTLLSPTNPSSAPPVAVWMNTQKPATKKSMRDAMVSTVSLLLPISSVTNHTLLFRSVYEHPAPGRSSLYDLDRGKSRTGLSLNSFYYNYDAPRSTLTYQLHYDEPQFVMDKRPRLNTIRRRQD